MSDWLPDYHQILLFRLLGITMLLGVVAVCGTLGCGLRFGYRSLAGRAPHAMPLWQRRTP
jgi:hypothetical protein